MQIDVANCSKLLVFSDLHIGDPRFCDWLLQTIWKAAQAEKPELLILAGDILEADLATGEQKAKLKSICGLSDRVIILQGNHDTTATQKFAQSIKADFGTTVVGTSNSRTFAVEHGSRFDSLWNKAPWLGKFLIWANRIIYRATKFDAQEWLRRFKCTINKLLKQHDHAKAAWPDKDIIITGHTHLPTNDPFGVGYFNSGDWLYHRTYVIVDNGDAKLKAAS